MSIDDKRRYAAAAFITLLVLSVFWPSPVVSINRLWLNRDLPVDELSFLGRESLSWDVLFWCIAGLLAIAIVQSGSPYRRHPAGRDAGILPAFGRQDGGGTAAKMAPVLGAAAIIAVALTWLLLDRPMLRWAEMVQSDATEAVVRILNRLGGGWNPPMVVLFFLLAGWAYRHRRWVSYAVAMALAGLAAGAIAHLLKFVIGRTRPELWLGAFHYARGGAVSFPSGHTVGAFALGGVLMFASRSIPVRVTALLLATAIALSRVLAFRHWTSDVLASALIGLFCAWFAVLRVDVREVDAHQP